MGKHKLLKSIKKWILCFITFSLTLGSFLWIGDKVFPLNLKRFNDTSTVIYGNSHELLHVFLTQDDKFRIHTTSNEVPPLYLKTLLAREDRLFYQHPGINPFSILKATYANLRSKRVVSGGSTLTMQTARLLEPKKRTLWSKVIECFRSLQLEWHLSKHDILTMYLTLSPMGRNIESVKGAAWVYFNKEVKKLNPAEIALLIALVKSPNTLRPDQSQTIAKLARNRVLQLMQTKQLITTQQALIYQNAPLPNHLNKLPREIPHLAWRLKQQYPHKHEIQTTIHILYQQQIEHLLKQYATFLPKETNTAILVLDNIKHIPIAYVGSREYDFKQAGFIDYIKTYRSPGSTLKPFIYGLMFESGSLQPDDYLVDIRRRFSSYYPRNFDKSTHGIVTVKEALALSLNIPAVNLLNKIGVIRFLTLLKEVNIEPKFPKNILDAGLSTALGGLGMTLEQLTLLYSGLANEGKVKPISYIKDDEVMSEKLLLSTSAAQKISHILMTENSKGEKISIKTGTSYGHRDAWALGYDKHYVIGIWIGIPEGSPMQDVTGANAAIPLLHKIHQSLPKNKIGNQSSVTPSDFSLKNFLPTTENTTYHREEELSLLFPVSDTIIHLEKHNNQIPCSVTGGARPYTWLINGKIASTQWQQKYVWPIENSGFYTLSVIDANGKSVKANFEVNVPT